MTTTTVIEKPMLFSEPMVRALLDGRKTQTRRVVKPQPKMVGGMWRWKEFVVSSGDHPSIFCPHPVGSRIWVKETWAECYDINQNGLPTSRPYMVPDEYKSSADWIMWRADGETEWVDEDGSHTEKSYWKSPLFMPRWASRITLEVTDVRVQRLQDITEEDARAEGVERYQNGMYRDYCGSGDMPVQFARTSFSTLWESIHGPDAWDKNPWVWAYTFRRVESEARYDHA